MHGWVGLLVKGTLKVLTWHPLYEPFLDLTFRYGFTILCGLGVPVGCRMKHAKGMFKRCGLGAALLPARFGVPSSFCTVCRV